MATSSEFERTLSHGAMAASSEAIVVVDDGGSVVFANPKAEALWGTPGAELAGRPFRGLRAESDGRIARAEAAMPAFVGVRRDGTEFDVDVRISPVPTSEGLCIALVVRSARGSRSAPGDRRTGDGPLAGSVPPAPERPSDVGEAAPRPRVLIVDDEAVVAKTLARILADEYACSVVAGGREAIRRIVEGDRYDAILCDLSMPDADGEAVHRAVAGAAPDQARRIIFVTGGAYTPAAQAFLAQVENPRVEKPFDSRMIRELVRALLATPLPTADGRD
jgi:PAS domain S-box-containing protein